MMKNAITKPINIIVNNPPKNVPVFSFALNLNSYGLLNISIYEHNL